MSTEGLMTSETGYRLVRMAGGRMQAHNFPDLAAFRTWLAGEGIEIIGEHRSPRTRPQLQGQPRLQAFVGPMWDGGAIRYEDAATNDTLST